jgi:ferrous iron transport protein B
VLASYGPGDAMEQAETRAQKQNSILSAEDLQNHIASERLEASYAGHFGHFIEPVIRPLGYDWKIGIALLSSFYAREVFVGTMATIYSIGDGGDDANTTVRERLRQEKNPETGGPMYTPALGWSLLIFYVFAMMCMSTLAATQRETKSWKWPAVQLTFMMGLAYIAAFITYQFMK